MELDDDLVESYKRNIINMMNFFNLEKAFPDLHLAGNKEKLNIGRLIILYIFELKIENNVKINEKLKYSII